MSRFKTIYFPDYMAGDAGGAGLTIPFSDREEKLHNAVSRLSSYTIRTVIGHNLYSDVKRAAEGAGLAVSTYIRRSLERVVPIAESDYDARKDNAIQSTFVGGKGSPLHDWFPYLEGYSPDFVRAVLEKYTPSAKSVFDPFCGSGTTALTAASMGLMAAYCEVNPVCQDVISAKSIAVESTAERRLDLSRRLSELSEDLHSLVERQAPDPRLEKTFRESFGERPFFDAGTYNLVLRLRTLADSVLDKDMRLGRLLEVAILGALVPSSLLVRRGDLRFRSLAELSRHRPDVIALVISRLRLMSSDLQDVEFALHRAVMVGADARCLETERVGVVDAIVTSPPYLNGTNYFRNTKIELWFQRHLTCKKDLRGFRDSAVTAGINDVTGSKTRTGSVPVISLLQETLGMLEKSTYDKRIPMMVSAYFSEMDRVIEKLRLICHDDTRVSIDLGDSCYGEVWVRTDIILREIMYQRGFCLIDEVVLRERQSRDGRRLKQTLQVFKVK